MAILHVRADRIGKYIAPGITPCLPYKASIPHKICKPRMDCIKRVKRLGKIKFACADVYTSASASAASCLNHNKCLSR